MDFKYVNLEICIIGLYHHFPRYFPFLLNIKMISIFSYYKYSAIHNLNILFSLVLSLYSIYMSVISMLKDKQADVNTFFFLTETQV